MDAVRRVPAATAFLLNFAAPARQRSRQNECSQATAADLPGESPSSVSPSAPSSRRTQWGCNARSAGGNQVSWWAAEMINHCNRVGKALIEIALSRLGPRCHHCGRPQREVKMKRIALSALLAG